MTDTRRKFLGLLVALSVLISGIAIGAAGMGFYVRSKIAQYFGTDAPERKDPLLTRLTREVGLSAEQAAVVRKLYDAQQAESKFAVLRALPQINEPKYELFEQVERTLTPQQLEGWKAFIAQTVVKRRPAALGELYVKLRLSGSQLRGFETAVAEAAQQLDLKEKSEAEGSRMIVEAIAPRIEPLLSAEQLEILHSFRTAPQSVPGAEKK